MAQCEDLCLLLMAICLDIINIATDKLPTGEYKVEEDPSHFVSEKSGRGPLSAKWLEEEHDQVMCSYKLCKVGILKENLTKLRENWSACDLG